MPTVVVVLVLAAVLVTLLLPLLLLLRVMLAVLHVTVLLSATAVAAGVAVLFWRSCVGSIVSTCPLTRHLTSLLGGEESIVKTMDAASFQRKDRRKVYHRPRHIKANAPQRCAGLQRQHVGRVCRFWRILNPTKPRGAGVRQTVSLGYFE